MEKENTKNSFGLYDAPVRSAEKRCLSLTQEQIELQLESGGFLMEGVIAEKMGFINQDDAQDAVIVDVRSEQ